MDVKEFDLVSCENEIVSFNKTVIVELDICDISNSTTIESEDWGILEDAFVSTYNGLAMEYCDPYFRTLDTASIIQQGSFTPDGHLTVEIQVTGNAVVATQKRPTCTTFRHWKLRRVVGICGSKTTTSQLDNCSRWRPVFFQATQLPTVLHQRQNSLMPTIIKHLCCLAVCRVWSR